MTREDDFLNASNLERWGELIRHVVLVHDRSIEKHRGHVIEGEQGLAYSLPNFTRYYSEFPNTAWIEPYLREKFKNAGFYNIFPASWWDGGGREAGGLFGINQGIPILIKIDPVNGLYFEPMYNAVNFAAQQDWAKPQSMFMYNLAHALENQFGGLPEGLPDVVVPLPPPPAPPEEEAPSWWKSLKEKYAGLLGLPPGGLSELLPDDWIIKAVDFVIPINALSKIFLEKSIYDGETAEVTIKDEIDLAIAVLILAGGAGLFAKLSGRFGTEAVAGKVAKGVTKAAETNHADAVTIGKAALDNPVIQKKTIEELAQFAIRDAEKAGPYFAKMGSTKFFDVMRLLEQTTSGRIAISVLFKSMYGARKPVFTKFLEKAPAGIKALLVLAGSLASVDLVIGYVGKEIPETAGLPVWALIEAEDWEAAYEANRRYEQFIDRVAEMPGQAWLRGFPIIGDYWNVVEDAQRAQVASYDEVIAANLPPRAVITITANVEAIFKIDGAPLSTFPSIRQVAVLTPVEPTVYSISAEAPGYLTVTVAARIVPKTIDTLHFDLPSGVPISGSLHVTVTPSDSNIWIGDNLQGTSRPLLVDLAPGTYSVRLEKQGYLTKVLTGIVKDGETTTLDWALVPDEFPEIPETSARVTFDSVPTGARIFIDDLLLDYPTPTNADLPAGAYTIRMEKRGFEPKTERIGVIAGQPRLVRFSLEEIPTPRVWRVHVSSIPAGAKILVNEQFTGAWTTGYVDLLPGTYMISVEKSGYEPDGKEITLAE